MVLLYHDSGGFTHVSLWVPNFLYLQATVHSVRTVRSITGAIGQGISQTEAAQSRYEHVTTTSQLNGLNEIPVMDWNLVLLLERRIAPTVSDGNKLFHM